jgi:hemerythrin-like domain-containing protein
MATTLPFGPRTPDAGFDQPFEMLAACHDRTRRSLALLDRLVDHLARHGVDSQARDAARDVQRYFTLAAPAHHEDEERHVVPALRTRGDAASAALADQLLADHVRIRSAWDALQPQLQAIAEAGCCDDLEALARAARHFAELHAEHLATEDRLAFPPAAQQLGTPAARRAMGAEMAARRGLKPGDR